MFRNGSGITFPFFLAGTVLYFAFSLSKLEITLKKGSAFYMVSILLLGVSTFCTEDVYKRQILHGNAVLGMGVRQVQHTQEDPF